MSTAIRIDAHQHYWHIARSDYGWLTPELAPIYRDFGPADLAPLLARAGISRTIAVQAAPSEAETHFLLDIAAREESVAGVVGWVDFDAADAPERIAAMAKNPLLVGLRPMIHDIPDPDWMLSPAVSAALEAMQRHGLVFDALVRPAHIPRLTVLAERHPGLSIVLDHCGKPLIAKGGREPWAADIAALSKREHVTVKLSGLATEAAEGWQPAALAPYIAHVLACFGPKRVLFGSDWPVLLLAGDYDAWLRVVKAAITPLGAEAREAILGENARRVYLGKRGRR